MRRILSVLGVSAALLSGGAGVATASTDWSWVGPFSTYESCEESAYYYQEAGGVAGGCHYRDLAYTHNDGYYYAAWPIP
jgi:hypothetical protein